MNQQDNLKMMRMLWDAMDLTVQTKNAVGDSIQIVLEYLPNTAPCLASSLLK